MGRLVNHKFVDELRPGQRAGQHGTGLDQHPVDAAFREVFEHGDRIDTATRTVRFDDRRAGGFERLPAIVVDDDQHPVGMFTERLLVRMLDRDPAGLDQAVDDHMIDCSRLTARLDEPVEHIIHIMQNAKIRFICVVDSNGRVHSLAGLRSLVEWIAEHFPRAVKVQGLEAKLYLDEREGA